MQVWSTKNEPAGRNSPPQYLCTFLTGTATLLSSAVLLARLVMAEGQSKNSSLCKQVSDITCLQRSPFVAGALGFCPLHLSLPSLSHAGPTQTCPWCEMRANSAAPYLFLLPKAPSGSWFELVRAEVPRCSVGRRVLPHSDQPFDSSGRRRESKAEHAGEGRRGGTFVFAPCQPQHAGQTSCLLNLLPLAPKTCNPLREGMKECFQAHPMMHLD